MCKTIYSLQIEKNFKYFTLLIFSFYFLFLVILFYSFCILFLKSSKKNDQKSSFLSKKYKVSINDFYKSINGLKTILFIVIMYTINFNREKKTFFLKNFSRSREKTLIFKMSAN